MNVQLTAEQQEIIRRAVETGRIRRAEDAVKQAIELWIERERTRDELVAAIDEAEASLASGEGVEITAASMSELAEDVKRHGRARLTAEKSTRR